MNDQQINNVLAHFDRTADQYFSREELQEKLRRGKPLRIKYGVDVRTPLLHIGHAVNLWLMRYMQDLGHKVVFVIGNFTTRIGDPDGRLETRPLMSKDDIAANIQSFIEQARLVLRFDDPALIEIRRNSEWYDKLTMSDFIDLASVVTQARLLSRDTFRERIAHNHEIYVHETLYPILQGYDSLIVESDLTIIGSDQLFNESMGRHLQEKHGKDPQTLVTTRITPGIDGRGKQSKSHGNYIGLAHSPRDKFGRTMSIPDELIGLYFKMYTDVPLNEVARISDAVESDPRAAKLRLARAIVARYHGEGTGAAEEEYFEHTISKGHAPEVMPTLPVMSPHIETLDLVSLCRPGKSRSDTRRLITQGGVEINGEKLKDPDALVTVKTNDILKVGKRSWYRIEISKPIRLETEHLWMEPIHMHEIDFLSKYLPAWELVKYLGLTPHEAPKLEEAKAREMLRDLIFQKDPKSEWLWKITLREEAEVVIGVSRLHRPHLRENTQNIWLTPEHANNQEIQREALTAINDYAFFMLDFQSMMFKDAFSFATQPKSMDVLAHIFTRLDPAQLNKEVPFGAAGFTQDGWKMLQDWRRTMSPWQFAPEPAPEPAPRTASRHLPHDLDHMPDLKAEMKHAMADPDPEPAPQPKAKPAARPKPKVPTLEPPMPKPFGEPEE